MTTNTYEARPFAVIAVDAPREPSLYRALLRPAASGASPAIRLRLVPWRHRIGGAVRNGRYKGVPWRYAAESANGEQRLSFSSPLLTSYLGFHIALLPALRELLFAHGEVILAGAAYRGGEGDVVLLGGTGAGKTGALLAAAERGCTPIADEYLSIDARGSLHALLSGIALRQNLRAVAPLLYRQLSSANRAQLAVARGLELASRGLFRPLVHVGWDELRVQLAPERDIPIADVVWLDATASRPRHVAPGEIAARAAEHQAVHDLAYLGGVRPAPATTAEAAARIAATLERTRCWIAGSGSAFELPAKSPEVAAT